MTSYQVHCYNSPHSGYYGKPTKSRSEEPSMFELLSFNLPNDHETEMGNPNACSNCNKCQHFKADHMEEEVEVYNPKNYHVKQISKNVEGSKYRRQSHREDHNSVSKKGILTQKNLLHDKSHLQARRSISPKIERPQSAKISSSKPASSFKKANKNVYQESPFQKENRVQQKNQEKIKKFKQITRWIPNSAFTTYFGKPAFENYGRGNTNPTSGGLLYGNYMKSHNVQPHRGQNSPSNVQSYSVALMKAKQIGQICPYPPKMNKKDIQVVERQLQQKKPLQINPIYAESNQMRSLPIRAPSLAQLQKFGGKGITKMSKTRFSVPNPQNYCQQ